MGEEETVESFPEWYLLVKAAQWLGVAPWDLANQPIWWMQWGLEGFNAEAHAEKKAIERARARKGKK